MRLLNRRLPQVLLGICAISIGVVLGAPAGAAPGQPAPDRPAGPCEEWDLDFCVEDQVPGGGGGGAEGPSATPVSNRPRPSCRWVVNAAWATANVQLGLPPQNPEAFVPETSTPLYQECDGAWTGQWRWVNPGDPVVTVTPDALAQAVFARLEGSLPEPQVASDPLAGEPAIISFPTFIQVSNWSGIVRDRECDATGTLCVSVTATPALTFSPGEPGSSTIGCSGSGSRFVDGGELSTAQAAEPGACAHAYLLRTGTAGRPAAWPGLATVTWTLTWESTSGVAGTLPDVVKSADVARQVNEVQTVIEQ